MPFETCQKSYKTLNKLFSKEKSDKIRPVASMQFKSYTIKNRIKRQREK